MTQDRTKTQSPTNAHAEDDLGDDDILPIVDPTRYLIKGERARGGNGRILEATEVQLGRPVAIKELLGTGPQQEARFVREAQLTSRLQHPAIVPVYEVGRWPSGKPMFVMKLVDGMCLRDAIHAATTLEARLALLPHVIAVVDAIAYAHQQGIIHRDLKPSNILLGPFGETVVIDWGLAKRIGDVDDVSSSRVDAGDALTSVTVEGSVLGTPAFMPPEQAKGAVANERSDVYALGAILYMLLAGHEPYRGDDARSVIAAVLDGPPTDIASLEQSAPVELTAIIRRAMARESSNRYPNADALRADLVRFQQGQLVLAHRYSRWELARRFVRRFSRELAIVAVAIGAVAATATVSLHRILEERHEAVRRSRELLLLSAEGALTRDPTEAVAWLKLLQANDSEFTRALEVLAEAMSRGVAEGVWRAREGFETRPRKGVFETKHVVFRADGSLLVGASNGQFRVAPNRSSSRLSFASLTETCLSQDGRAQYAAAVGFIARIGDDGHRLEAQPLGDVLDLACAPDGRYVAVATPHAVIVLDYDLRWKGIVPRVAESIVFADENHLMICTRGSNSVFNYAIGGELQEVARRGMLMTTEPVGGPFPISERGEIKTIDVVSNTKKTLHSAGPFRALRVDRLQPYAATVDTRSGLWRWNLETGAHRRYPLDLPTGKMVDTSIAGEHIALWQGNEARLLDTYGVSRLSLAGAWSEAAWSRDSQRLAAINADGTLRIWDTRRFFRHRVSSLNGVLFTAAFSPDGRTLIAGAQDGTIHRWDTLSNESRALSSPEFNTPNFTLGWTASGRSFVSVDFFGGLVVWDGSTSEPQRRVDLGGSIWGCFGLPRTQLACVGHEGELRVLDLSSRMQLDLVGHRGEVRGAVWSAEGQLLSYGAHGTVLFWNRDLRSSAALIGHAAEVNVGEISADGQTAITGDERGEIWMWNVSTKSGQRIGGFGSRVSAVSFINHDREVVVTSMSGALRIYGVRSGEMIEERHHASGIRALALSPNGSVFATGARDGTVRLWDAASKRIASVLRCHSDEVRRVVFSPQGDRLASVAHDGKVCIWPVDEVLRLPANTADLAATLEQITSATIVDGKVISIR